MQYQNIIAQCGDGSLSSLGECNIVNAEMKWITEILGHLNSMHSSTRLK